MQIIQHIVVATDFSPSADLAITRAALLAKQLRAELHLIHIVHPLDLYVGSELAFEFQAHYQQVQQQSIQSRLDVFSDKLHEQFGITIHTASRIGRAPAEITHYAVSVNADLIVVGAQGESAILEKLLGSNALHLLKLAKCPVLIVKNKNTFPKNYQKLIAAVDFSAGAQGVPALAATIAPEAAIEALLVFNSSQEAHLHKTGMNETLLSKYRNQVLVNAAQHLDTLVNAHNSRFTPQILSGYPPKTICERARSVQADLIVIGKHNKNSVEDWLLGSVSKEVAHDASCDVLLSN